MAEPAAEPPDAPDLELRMVEPGDEGAILELHEAVYETPLDPGLLQWKIRYNIDRLAANGFDGYGAGVLVLQDNRIIAFNSYQTRRLRFRGQEMLVAESGTTMALPETWGMHTFSRMIQFAGDTLGAYGVPFIYGVVNQHSERAGLKAGALRVGALRLFSLRPGRIRKAIASMTRRKANLPESEDQDGLPVANTERVDSILAQAEAGALDGGFSIEFVRDAAAWRQRYVDHPNHKYHLARCGATAFVLRLKAKPSGPAASICDLAPVPPSSQDAALPGLDTLLAMLKRQEIENVDCWATEGSPMSDFLCRAGFLPGPEAMFPVMMFPTSDNSPALPGSLSSFFMAGDFDIV